MSHRFFPWQVLSTSIRSKLFPPYLSSILLQGLEGQLCPGVRYQMTAHVLSLSASGSLSRRWGICANPTSGATCSLLSPGSAPRQVSRPPCNTALHHPAAPAHSFLLFGTGGQAINTQKVFFYLAAPGMTLFTFMDEYVE